MKRYKTINSFIKMKFLRFLLVFIVIQHGYAQSNDDNSPNTYRFQYRSESYKGTKAHITDQIRTLKNNSFFINIPEEKQTELNKLFTEMKSQAIPKYYKKDAIRFLDALYDYEAFLKIYEAAMTDVVKDLKAEMRRIDFKFEREFTKSKILLERTKKEDPDNLMKIDRLTEDATNSKTKLLCHRWMKKIFDRYPIDIVKNPDDLLQEFKKYEAMNTYKLYQENKIGAINGYLENQIIDFYYKKSLPEIDSNLLDLNYIVKM